MNFLSLHTESLGLLIDPEKYQEENYLKEQVKISFEFDVILVGGSTCTQEQIISCIDSLKDHFRLPIYLFPGGHHQFYDKADGILYLSLISGNNPNFLIGEHRKSSVKVKTSKITIIPTGYMLLTGDHISSIEKMSETKPIDQNNIDEIVGTAVAGELLGMKTIYLEAGSGAKKSVAPEIIKRVRQEIDIPLIVGGGIRTREQIEAAFENGANLVVIGTFIEENIENITELSS